MQKLQTATWRLSIGNAIFLTNTRTKTNLLLYSAPRLTLRKQGIKKIRRKNYLESKYQPCADQLVIYEVKTRS